MKKIYSFLLFAFSFQLTMGQLVINELDSDTPSIDTQEFIEIKSDDPYFPLDGYVVVLFNGSSSGGNTSYYTIDLAGYMTDINGLLLIGSNGVSPTPQYFIYENTIQNGADAVAIYQGTYESFPEGTLATTTNLIDALVYGTGDSDATGLMNLLNVTMQIDENENGNQANESIQRANDGSYFIGTPTPRLLNEGGGFVQNGISISTSQTEYFEGETFEIVFTTEQNVAEDFTFSFTLSNGGFDASDFTGSTDLTIANGTNSATATINLVDDTQDEGDEILIINISNIPDTFLVLNNNKQLRAIDNDFVIADWGTPLNPTYGIVEGTQPENYYNSLNGLSGEALRQEIQNIIAEEGVVRAQTYADVIDILKEADQNPENSNQVWLVYVEEGRSKLDYQTTSINTGKWNKEHTYPRSRGGFYSIEEDGIADGPEVYWNTNADSLRHGNSDAHALRASDGPENSSRGNQHYGQYNGPEGTAGSFKGDVARSVLYMAIRYNGLAVVNGFPETVGEFGDLQTILDWHRNDPPDDFEMNRNNVVYNWQMNRNPFIDEPELVEYIWGEHTGENWDGNLSVHDVSFLKVQMHPNPAENELHFSGLENSFQIEILSVQGRVLLSERRTSASFIQLNLPRGLYLVRITSNGSTAIKKLMVK